MKQSQNLATRIEALYHRYGRKYDNGAGKWFADAIADLTPAEIDSAFREGPKTWKFMPSPAEFRDAVLVEPGAGSCEKCANGFVPDPEGGPNAVKRCECRKKSADAHGKR